MRTLLFLMALAGAVIAADRTVRLKPPTRAVVTLTMDGSSSIVATVQACAADAQTEFHDCATAPFVHSYSKYVHDAGLAAWRKAKGY